MAASDSKFVVITDASICMGQAAAIEVAERGHTAVDAICNPDHFDALRRGGLGATFRSLR